MVMTRRSLGLLIAGFGGLLIGPGLRHLGAQDQAPNRREFTITAKDFAFSPGGIEVMQDDLVTLTVRSEDIAHSFTIDEYRIVKRVPAGGATTFEFRADRAGTFTFYCNLTSEQGHASMKGQLVVRTR
jgi:heme/copper-type cytochrome/quinol oxidase subunit 2